MIYFDMDGVLADFTQHTTNLKIPNNHQWFEPKDTWTEETWKGEKIKTDAMHSRGFWNSLPIMPGGKHLWDYCVHRFGIDNISVLTCQPQEDSPALVAEEKYEWITKNLGEMWPDHFHCVNHGQKKDYLKPGDILIDDDKRHSSGMHPDAYFIHHVAEYERDGGSIVMIKEPDVEATIKEIEKVYS